MEPTGLIETVDSSGNVGTYTSLALDATGTPHISYHRSESGDLRYATRTDTGWRTQRVDRDENVGRYTSLALDAAGSPHISYYDAENRDLKYARWDGTRWIIEGVDTNPRRDRGMYASLALDVADNPHITYYDAVGGDLLYAARTQSGWSREAVDSVVGDSFSMSGLLTLVTGQFDTPTTLAGSYWVALCDSTLVIPPSSGEWTATWQRDSSASSDTDVPSGADLSDFTLSNLQAVYRAEASSEVAAGHYKPLSLEHMAEQVLPEDWPELLHSIEGDSR